MVDGARVIVRSASGRPIVVRSFRAGRPLVGLNLPVMVSGESVCGRGVGETS